MVLSFERRMQCSREGSAAPDTRQVDIVVDAGWETKIARCDGVGCI
jgi:hypothetical protein